jgi:hypothetical protein
MANSTTLITDLTTLTNSVPNAASLAKIKGVDVIGMASSAFQSAAQAKMTLKAIAAQLDASDPMLTLVDNLLGTLS